MQDIEELLKPRYEVTAPWPGCSYVVGDILTQAKGLVNYYECEEKLNGLIGFPEKYPANLCKLNWWEHRKPEDMPEYVKLIYNDRVQYIHKV